MVGWQQFTSHVMGSMPLDSITAQYGNGTKLLAALIKSPIQHLKNLYWFELRYPAHFVFPFIPLGSVLSSPVPFFLAIPTLGLMGIGWFERVRGGASPGDIWVPCLGLLTYLMSVNSHGVRYWLTLLPILDSSISSMAYASSAEPPVCPKSPTSARPRCC